MANATNKSYLVIGADGAELKTVRTLAAAKKLADAEGGFVLVDGECVYRAAVTSTDGVEKDTIEKSEVEKEEEVAEKGEVEKAGEVEPVDKAEEVSGEVAEKTTEVKNDDKLAEKTRYRIKALMNIRRAPNLKGEKAGIARQGTIVTVKEVVGDWLHLKDGTFILFGGGEFAERIPNA